MTTSKVSVEDAKVIAKRLAVLTGAPGDGTSVIERAAATLVPGERLVWTWPTSGNQTETIEVDVTP